MFRAVRQLLWIRGGCSLQQTLLISSFASRLPSRTLPTPNLIVRTSAFLNSHVHRPGGSLTTCIAQGLVDKTFYFNKLAGMTSQAGGPKKDFSSSAEEAEPWNCYHDEMVKLVENGGAIIIDVRRDDEVEVTGLMNRACHIPLSELKETLSLPNDALKEKYGWDTEPNTDGSNVVFTCRSGRRSLLALEVAKEFGYTKARHYPGGWNSWTAKRMTTKL